MPTEIGFHENVRFPEDISWGTRGGPMFKTRVFTAHRGKEQRNAEWREPMMGFNVAYGVKTDVQMQRLIAFFQARRGRAYGFRYKNWMDYRVDAGLVAVGDGFSRRLALYKEKSVGTYKFYKRLRKIVQGSVTGVLQDATPITEGTDFVINYNTGEMIFDTIVPYGTPIYATLEFDEPVRFDIDTLQAAIDAYNSNSTSRIPLVTYRGTFGELGDDAAISNPYAAQEQLYLEFVEGTGTSTTDSSVVGHTVTFNGTASMVSPSKFGISTGALSLGSSGYVSVPGTNFQFASSVFTVELFATKPTEGSDNQPLVALWDDTSQKGWKLNYDFANNRIEFKISTDGSTETEVLSYAWTETASPRMSHIAVDRQPNNWYTLRINGVVVDSTKQAGTIHNSTAALTVGDVASPVTGEGSFQGNIDSVRITRYRNRYLGFLTTAIPDVAL